MSHGVCEMPAILRGPQCVKWKWMFPLKSNAAFLISFSGFHLFSLEIILYHPHLDVVMKSHAALLKLLADVWQICYSGRVFPHRWALGVMSWDWHGFSNHRQLDCLFIRLFRQGDHQSTTLLALCAWVSTGLWYVCLQSVEQTPGWAV